VSLLTTDGLSSHCATLLRLVTLFVQLRFLGNEEISSEVDRDHFRETGVDTPREINYTDIIFN
jgi:hypothetical protein